MREDCLAELKYFSDHYAYVPSQPDFFIEEKSRGGEGKAYFRHDKDCIVLKSGKSGPLLWSLKNGRIGEGAILTHEEDGFHLHLLEMKSRLTQGEWSKAVTQFEGMFLTSVAAIRLLGAIDLQSVTCYVAFRRDDVSNALSADMILMKTFVGMSNPFSGLENWENETVSLPFATTASLKKGLRDEAGDVNFGEI